MNQGDETAAALERARCKLLFADIPKRFSTNTELRVRFTIWRDGRFNLLFMRITE